MPNPGIPASTASCNSAFLLFQGVNRPGHARSIVGNPETSQSIEQNDSPVAIEPLLQIVHRFRRDPLGKAAGFDAIRRPLREHQLHDGLAPSGGGSGRAEIVGIAAAADQRRVAETARSFIERAPGRGRSRDIAVAIERDSSDRIVRDGGSEQIVAAGYGLGLICTQALDLPGDDQIFVAAESHAVLGGKALGTLRDKIDVRTVAKNFPGGTNRIAQALDATDAPAAQRPAVHDKSVKLHLAIAVQETAAASVKRLVVFKNDNGFFNRIESGAAVFQS